MFRIQRISCFALALVLALFLSTQLIPVRSEAGVLPFSYHPKNEWTNLLDTKCSPFLLEEIFSQYGTSPWELQRELNDYFTKCDDEIVHKNTAKTPNFIEGLLKLINLRYKYTGVERVVIESADGTKINALVAAQKNQVRPLVVVKCGLLCVIDGTSMIPFLIHLFEESPFHVVILPNFTGINFELDNQMVLAGGAQEGPHTLRLIRSFRRENSPIKKYLDPKWISEVHLAGASLGGHAALYASLIDSYHSTHRAGYKKQLQTVLSACPVVDLEASLTDLFENPKVKFVGNLMKRGIVKQFKKLFKELPIIRDTLGFEEPVLEGAEIRKLVARGSIHAQKQLPPIPAPFSIHEFSNEEDFWAANRFQDHAAGITIPTLIWAPQDDPVVRYGSNSVKLKYENPNLGILSTRTGSHCLYFQAYGWNLEGIFIRSAVGKRSQLVSMHMQKHELRLADIQDEMKGLKKISSRTQFVKYRWKASARKNKAKLYIRIYDKKICTGLDFIKGCIRKLTFDATDFGVDLKSHYAANNRSLSRWLNANVRLEPIPLEIQRPEDVAIPFRLRWSLWN